MAGVPHRASPRSARARPVRPVRDRVVVWMSFGSKGATSSSIALSDRGELSAGQFGVNQEAERIRQLALFHQLDQDRVPELG